MGARGSSGPLLMLDRWLDVAVGHMPSEFSTHDFVEKLREFYPADYAHDLAVCTVREGFPASLAVLHQAIAIRLRRSERVRSIGLKSDRNIRGNRHASLVWNRLDARAPSRRPRIVRVRPKGQKPVRQPLRPTLNGNQLEAARLARGWTQAELARRAGVSLSAVNRWECGERRMTDYSYSLIKRALAVDR